MILRGKIKIFQPCLWVPEASLERGNRPSFLNRVRWEGDSMFARDAGYFLTVNGSRIFVNVCGYFTTILQFLQDDICRFSIKLFWEQAQKAVKYFSINLKEIYLLYEGIKGVLSLYGGQFIQKMSVPSLMNCRLSAKLQLVWWGRFWKRERIGRTCGRAKKNSLEPLQFQGVFG